MPTILRNITATITGTNGNYTTVFTDDVGAVTNSIGIQGEHLVTELEFVLPSEWSAFIGTDAVFVVEYKNAKGTTARSEETAFPADGVIGDFNPTYDIPFDALYLPETIFHFNVYQPIDETSSAIVRSAQKIATVGRGFIAGTPANPFGNDIFSQLRSWATNLFMTKTASNSDVGAMLYDVDYTVTGSEPTGSQYWDDDEKTLSTVLGGGVVGQHFREMYVYGKNTSGVTIANGQAVSINSAGGSFTTFEPTDIGDDDIAKAFVGVATQEILNNAFGFITTRGVVRGLDTSAFSDGDILYVDSSAGDLVNTLPIDASQYVIRVGIVEYAHATNGRINIQPTIYPKLQDLSGIDGTALSASGQIPVWNNTGKYFDFDYNIANYLTATEIAGLLAIKLDDDFTGEVAEDTLLSTDVVPINKAAGTLKKLTFATISTWLAETATHALDTTAQTIKGAINELFSNKVDKVAGSSLVADTTVTDLTDGGDTILHKHDTMYYTEDETDALLADKVDVVAGKSLVSDTEISKLATVESGAEVNNISDTNAALLTGGVNTVLHKHDGMYYTEDEVNGLVTGLEEDIALKLDEDFTDETAEDTIASTDVVPINKADTTLKKLALSTIATWIAETVTYALSTTAKTIKGAINELYGMYVSQMLKLLMTRIQLRLMFLIVLIRFMTLLIVRLLLLLLKLR